MMKAEKISIIVPVYNSINYLAKCLNSIVQQSYSNIEVIVVDDCSTDGSENICRNFQAKYKTIKYFRLTENKGVSHARNFGLKKATGELIGFVDSDDWIDDDTYKILYDEMHKNNSDMVSANYRYINCNTGSEIKYGYIHKEAIVIDNTVDNLIYAIQRRDVVLWNKLYKRNLLDGVVFPEGMIYEDIDATHKILENATNVSISTHCIYNYNLRPNSITRTNDRTHKVFDHLQVVINRHEYLSKKYNSENLTLLCLQHIFTTLIHVVDNISHINVSKEMLDACNHACNLVFSKYPIENCGFNKSQIALIMSLKKGIQHYKISRDIYKF